jgi:hypothetical protein
MGRFINGDIEHKFWFGVQASNDADFFGVTGEQPEELEYYFDKDNLPAIEKGIDTCKCKLNEDKQKLDKFFEKNDAYNDEMIMKCLNVTKEKAKEQLKWYARLELGEKILKCVKEEDSCSFTAEC